MGEVQIMTKIYRTKKIVQSDKHGVVVKVHDSVKGAALWVRGLFTPRQLYNHMSIAPGGFWHGYYWDWLEDVGVGASERRCIGVECNRIFTSRGAHNRLCPRCIKRGGENPIAYKVHKPG